MTVPSAPRVNVPHRRAERIRHPALVGAPFAASAIVAAVVMVNAPSPYAPAPAGNLDVLAGPCTIEGTDFAVVPEGAPDRPFFVGRRASSEISNGGRCGPRVGVERSPGPPARFTVTARTGPLAHEVVVDLEGRRLDDPLGPRVRRDAVRLGVLALVALAALLSFVLVYERARRAIALASLDPPPPGLTVIRGALALGGADPTLRDGALHGALGAAIVSAEPHTRIALPSAPIPIAASALEPPATLVDGIPAAVVFPDGAVGLGVGARTDATAWPWSGAIVLGDPRETEAAALRLWAPRVGWVSGLAGAATLLAAVILAATR